MKKRETLKSACARHSFSIAFFSFHFARLFCTLWLPDNMNGKLGQYPGHETGQLYYLHAPHSHSSQVSFGNSSRQEAQQLPDKHRPHLQTKPSEINKLQSQNARSPTRHAALHSQPRIAPHCFAPQTAKMRFEPPHQRQSGTWKSSWGAAAPRSAFQSKYMKNETDSRSSKPQRPKR